MDGLYWETWYNSRNLTEDEKGYIYYENKVLGVPRLRQVRVRNNTCTIDKNFESEVTYFLHPPWTEAMSVHISIRQFHSVIGFVILCGTRFECFYT